MKKKLRDYTVDELRRLTAKCDLRKCEHCPLLIVNENWCNYHYCRAKPLEDVSEKCLDLEIEMPEDEEKAAIPQNKNLCFVQIISKRKAK